jgi:hypothetical protein
LNGNILTIGGLFLDVLSYFTQATELSPQQVSLSSAGLILFCLALAIR